MRSAGKQTEHTLGYPLETCVLFCAVIREEMQVLISVGTSQCISQSWCLMRRKPPGSCSNMSDALWVCCVL